MRWTRDLRRWRFLLTAVTMLGFAFRPGAAQASDASSEAAVFERACAACHTSPTGRPPTRASLSAMSSSFIVDSLTNGMMKAKGSALTLEEQVALAEYLTGRKLSAEAPMADRCPATSAPLTLDGPSFNGWGASVENWRFQPDPGLSASDLPRLELKWAFGVPGAILMFAQPTVAAGRVFIGGPNGHV
jgi:polyvinyl alcohol dehydrogenase (cytochrome)